MIRADFFEAIAGFGKLLEQEEFNLLSDHPIFQKSLLIHMIFLIEMIIFFMKKLNLF
jgi:hypothetical protein